MPGLESELTSLEARVSRQGMFTYRFNLFTVINMWKSDLVTNLDTVSTINVCEVLVMALLKPCFV